VKVKLDIHGIFNAENAELVEYVDQPPSTPETKPMDIETDGSKTEDPKKEEEAKKEEAKKEEAKKRKVSRTELSITSQTHSLNPKDLQHAIDEEQRMIVADQLAIETADRKNAVESYVYNMRSQLTAEFADFSLESEKTTLLKLLDTTEEWLYGDGEDVAKNIYQGKLDEMKKLGDPIATRKRESETRPDALHALVDAIAYWQTEATSTDEKYDHIEKAEKDKILAEVGAARDWLVRLRSQQDALPKTSNPVLLTEDIVSRKNNLEKICRPIVSKPKPKPKPVDPPKPAEPAKPETEGTKDQTQPQQSEPTPQSPNGTPNAQQPETPVTEPTDSSMEVD